MLARGKVRGTWALTPKGRAHSENLVADLDLVALTAEAAATGGVTFGGAMHPTIPPHLAPPELNAGLRQFMANHPFELNVFAMTRFPEERPDGPVDPVAAAVSVAREVCKLHGLELHLASDRAIHDDLWTNVVAHMWASKYGVAFFEDRVGRGMNYNLTIEVGSMLMSGRRCALLKDTTVERFPVDLVGRIHKSVDLEQPSTVKAALHAWIRDDLNLGSCDKCK
jgi:hypothetical protein